MLAVQKIAIKCKQFLRLYMLDQIHLYYNSSELNGVTWGINLVRCSKPSVLEDIQQSRELLLSTLFYDSLELLSICILQIHKQAECMEWSYCLSIEGSGFFKVIVVQLKVISILTAIITMNLRWLSTAKQTLELCTGISCGRAQNISQIAENIWKALSAVITPAD